MDMAENQQGWLTYDGSKDCSHGVCTVYCPQWCYVLLPPPPAFSLSGADEDDSGTSFSPLVIAIIGILASALVLVSYYTFISKHCAFFSFHRRYLNRHHPSPDEEQHGGDRSLFHEGLPSNGLDEAQINKITVCRYQRGEGPVEGTDCSVCLAEFREEDDLRLLPKCNHAFHLQCIDTWLRAHSSCPLCRANIVSAAPAITDLESVTSA